MFSRSSHAAERAAFDGELWRNELRVRRGLDARTDIEIELAALYGSAGFLDPLVDHFHGFFSLPDHGRSAVERDQYAMHVRSRGTTLYQLTPHQVELQDVPVVVTRRLGESLERDGAWALAWRAGIELPAGSVRDGAGNGELDFGAGILGERSDGRWTRTFALDFVRTGDSALFERASVEAEDLILLQAGLEWRCSEDSSVLVLASALSPLARDLGLEETGEPALDLGLGFARDLSPHARWFVSFHEDLLAEIGTDFTLYAGWSFAP